MTTRNSKDLEFEGIILPSCQTSLKYIVSSYALVVMQTAQVRPHIVGAVLRNITLDEASTFHVISSVHVLGVV